MTISLQDLAGSHLVDATLSPDDFAAGCAWVDGRFVPVGQAGVPLLDRGFLRSDVTYDAMHVWEGSIFRLDDHLARFQRNIDRLRMRAPVSMDEVRDIVFRMVRMTGLRAAFVSVICTRGVPPQGVRDPRQSVPRFYAYAVPFIWMKPFDQHAEGLSLHVSAIPRIAVASVDPTTKNFHWGDLTAGLFEAYDNGCDTNVLTDGAGNITEGPGFNVFVVRDGRLATPDSGVFDGMTRRTVLELAGELGIEADMRKVSIPELYDADEVFLTTTVGGVVPITRLGRNRVLGNGSAGPVTWQLREAYWSRKRDGWLSEAIFA